MLIEQTIPFSWFYIALAFFFSCYLFNLTLLRPILFYSRLKVSGRLLACGKPRRLRRLLNCRFYSLRLIVGPLVSRF